MSEVLQGHPRDSMRRKDREIKEPAEIEAILRSGHLMHIALVDGDMPFLVPVFYGYDGHALYFHSAKTGTKIKILKQNNNICFEISEYQGILTSDIACDFEAKHRTVIGIGKATFVEDEREKKKALDMIVAQFSNKTFDYPERNYQHTTVIRIDIDTIKGKKHGV